MKQGKFVKKTALFLCAAMLSASLTGCGTEAQALTSDVSYVTVENDAIWQDHTDALADFSYDMLRYTADLTEESILVSPLSAWFVLTMTGQGAAGETKSEFAWFSKRLDDGGQRTLAAWMMEYLEQNYGAENENVQVGVANSVWCDESLDVKESFVDTAKGFYRE